MCGIRIAAAAAIVREAKAGGWTEKMHAVWLLRGPGMEFEDIARRLGYSQRNGPWYAWQTILGTISEVLRVRREACEERVTEASNGADLRNGA